MTYQEALLTLAEKILTDDLEGAIATCSEFPELTKDDQDDLRSQLTDLLGDRDILAGKDVNGIIDAFELDAVDVFKAIIDIRRNTENYSTAAKVKASNAYTLVTSSDTQYYDEFEKYTLVKGLSSLAISTRDVTLVKEMLAKVKELGI